MSEQRSIETNSSRTLSADFNRSALGAENCTIVEAPAPKTEVSGLPPVRWVGYSARGEGEGCIDACTNWANSLPEVSSVTILSQPGGYLCLPFVREEPVSRPTTPCTLVQEPTPFSMEQGEDVLEGFFTTGSGDEIACRFACADWRDALFKQYNVPPEAQRGEFQTNNGNGFSGDFSCFVSRVK